MPKAKKNINEFDSKTVIWLGVGAVLLLSLLSIGFFGGIPKNEVKLTIDFGRGNQRNFTTSPKEGITAWDLLQQANAVYGIPIETEGNFKPKSIGGISNGDGGKKWNFYLNGRIRQESPFEEKLSGGERILFKFE